MSKMIKLIALLMVILCILIANSCYANLGYYGDNTDGFPWGLWHGVMSCVKFAGSVIAPQNIHVYNNNNNGFMYNMGFFATAFILGEITLPLLAIAWVLRGIFWVIMAILALSPKQ